MDRASDRKISKTEAAAYDCHILLDLWLLVITFFQNYFVNFVLLLGLQLVADPTKYADERSGSSFSESSSKNRQR